MEKAALLKAIGVCALSWAAIPVLYYMFKKREVSLRVMTPKILNKSEEKDGSKNEKSSGSKISAENGGVSTGSG